MTCLVAYSAGWLIIVTFAVIIGRRRRRRGSGGRRLVVITIIAIVAGREDLALSGSCGRGSGRNVVRRVALRRAVLRERLSSLRRPDIISRR